MATKVVGLNGTAGSGKSEAASHLVNTHGYSLIKFAGPLKAMLAAYYAELGLSDEDIDRRIEGDLKEEPDPYLCGQTPRHAMQTLGTEWGRVNMDPDFWTRAWGMAVEKEPGAVAVDDVRFENEATAVRNHGGEIVKLVPKSPRRKRSQHVSESQLKRSSVQHTIKNDGTIQDLRVEVTRVVEPDYCDTFHPLEE